LRRIRGGSLAPSLAAAVLAIGVTGTTAGCGGSERKSKQEPAGEQGGGGEPKGESEREAAEKRKALEKVPPEDSTAFYQLATTTGLLSGRAALISRGMVPRGGAELKAATRRVRSLRPRDGDLQHIRDELLRTLGRTPAAGDARGARTTLAATSSLTLNLQAFTRKHPQYGALAPD
jgi:hypothetical protein